MGLNVGAINPAKYGKLFAEVLPRVIESRREFDRLAAKMEAIHLKKHASPEEMALAGILGKLIQDYDDRTATLPLIAPHKVILQLMENRGLRQADLLEVFGSRSAASNVLTGKREVSKAQARKLADFFKLSIEAFL